MSLVLIVHVPPHPSPPMAPPPPVLNALLVLVFFCISENLRVTVVLLHLVDGLKRTFPLYPTGCIPSSVFSSALVA